MAERQEVSIVKGPSKEILKTLCFDGGDVEFIVEGQHHSGEISVSIHSVSNNCGGNFFFIEGNIKVVKGKSGEGSDFYIGRFFTGSYNTESCTGKMQAGLPNPKRG